MDQQRIARFTHAGVADADVSVHPFATGDGLGLTLTRFHRKQSDDVVLLVHGLTTSSDMYVMPEHTNLVNYLHDAGFGDVWALDFRMSGRFPYNAETQRYNLDDIALFDHPAAMAELRRHIGDRRVHVISHCLGAVSFSMALFAGTVTGVTSLVCNSVSLTPRTPLWSRVKLAYGPALMEYVVGPCHLDPRYGAAPVLTRGWTLAKAVGPFHRDCAEPACHMLSFMWGGGKPIFTHEKMSPVTHGRLPDLFGACNVHYYRHIHAMVKAGRAVKYAPARPGTRACRTTTWPAPPRSPRRSCSSPETATTCSPTPTSSATAPLRGSRRAGTSWRSCRATATRTSSWARASTSRCCRRCSTSSSGRRADAWSTWTPS